MDRGSNLSPTQNGGAPDGGGIPAQPPQGGVPSEPPKPEIPAKATGGAEPGPPHEYRATPEDYLLWGVIGMALAYLAWHLVWATSKLDSINDIDRLSLFGVNV